MKLAEPRRCKTPSCGIEFAFTPGVNDPDYCYFCSLRRKRERLAAAGDAARHAGEESSRKEQP